MFDYVGLIPLFPLLGFLVIGLLGSYIKNEKLIGIIGSSTILLSFLVTVLIFSNAIKNPDSLPYISTVYTWITAGNFSVNISYQVDQLSILFSMIITGIGFLIHVYSIGYMHGDRSFYRFFAYLNLFVFMMLNLVLADNYLLTFFGWEGVGLASYLLIGFWYDQKFEGFRLKWTGDASNKAFIMNRIGDFGFLLAMFLIYINFGSLDYNEVNLGAFARQSELIGSGLITSIALLIFLACTGKSAQLPLAGWLPDAMAGPTSVSALIHAATMVTSGIFLIARNSTIFALAPDAMTVVAIVGVLTALIAASIGIVQNDIKKVLAYSTVSQLGFMFAALGVGAWVAGVFHVMTHAFFKGLMFLGAGSVIHGMHHQQDIKKMGNVKKYMPITYWTFLAGTLAIAGIPFFSGFFSKDEILWMVFSKGDSNHILWLLLAIAAFFTAFYMFRLVYLTFHGKERFDISHHKPHESPSSMTIPLIILAVLSVFGGFLGIPHLLGHDILHLEHPNLLENFLEPIFSNANSILPEAGHYSHTIEYGLMAFSTIVAIVAILLARRFYKLDENWATPRNLVKNMKSTYGLLKNKWFIDEVYFLGFVDPIVSSSRNFFWKIFDIQIVDGIVNGTARFIGNTSGQIRKLQSGIAQNYAILMFFGIISIMAYLIFA